MMSGAITIAIRGGCSYGRSVIDGLRRTPSLTIDNSVALAHYVVLHEDILIHHSFRP